MPLPQPRGLGRPKHVRQRRPIHRFCRSRRRRRWTLASRSAGSRLPSLRLRAAGTARLGPRHDRVAGQRIPVEVEVRVRVFERLAHFAVERRPSYAEIGGRSKEIKHAGRTLAVPVLIEHERVVESTLVAGLPDERHIDLRLPLARGLRGGLFRRLGRLDRRLRFRPGGGLRLFRLRGRLGDRRSGLHWSGLHGCRLDRRGRL